jgi:hypothetical protein
MGGLGVIIEVARPEEETIKAIDMRALSKIMEFCEKPATSSVNIQSRNMTLCETAP